MLDETPSDESKRFYQIKEKSMVKINATFTVTMPSACGQRLCSHNGAIIQFCSVSLSGFVSNNCPHSSVSPLLWRDQLSVGSSFHWSDQHQPIQSSEGRTSPSITHIRLREDVICDFVPARVSSLLQCQVVTSSGYQMRNFRISCLTRISCL